MNVSDSIKLTKFKTSVKAEVLYILHSTFLTCLFMGCFEIGLKFIPQLCENLYSMSLVTRKPVPNVMKHFFIMPKTADQLIMKFKLLIKNKIAQINEILKCQSPKSIINPTHKSQNANNCWHFDIYEQDKFHGRHS